LCSDLSHYIGRRWQRHLAVGIVSTVDVVVIIVKFMARFIELAE